MDLIARTRRLLKEMGAGQRISRSPYDTAWLTRLSILGDPIGEKALDWLRAHQLSDGSWGAAEPRYHHDRLICTLAAVTALARQRDPKDRYRLERAQLALETVPQGLRADPAGATIGFEMIVPTLVAEAKELGVIQQEGNSALSHLSRYRAAKLAALPDGIINRFVTVAFSAEMVGSDGLHLLDVDNLREANGSVAYSPAATTFFTLQMNGQHPRALDYLRSITTNYAAPYIAPIEVFECGWTLWNLGLLGPLDEATLQLCQPHLDFLESEWIPGKGIAACAGLTLIEADTTSVVYEALHRFGRPADLDAVLHYEERDHFRCFELEANPSISTNIHVLGALRRSGLDLEHPAVEKVLKFLLRTQTLRLFWFDKWHTSPYYTTAHAIIACAGYVNWLISDSIYWVLETQNDNGSWGYYMPTAEETAYCLQALVVWRQQGGKIPDDVLKRGYEWLAEHADPPYPPLWIGKSLYCPEIVVESAILSALMLVARE